MGLISLLWQMGPLVFFTVAVLLLFSIIAHEVAHGWVANLFGDDTAKRYGRLTFNPLPHIDLIGLFMLLFVGFGWAKPVPVNYNLLKRSRFGVIAVSLAGCLTNILLAIIASIAKHILTGERDANLKSVLDIFAYINIMLGTFNLIPIPPLDGSRILAEFLPRRGQEGLARLEPYGFFILIALILTHTLDPVLSFMRNTITGLISLLFH